jgi:cytochrome c oxidase assembly factor CtaG
MNKKLNTVLFFLGATLFHMLVTIICFIALFLLYTKIVLPFIPEGGRAWGFPMIFIGSIALAFIIYQGALKALTKKVAVEKYFDPIFGKKQK